MSPCSQSQPLKSHVQETAAFNLSQTCRMGAAFSGLLHRQWYVRHIYQANGVLSQIQLFPEKLLASQLSFVLFCFMGVLEKYKCFFCLQNRTYYYCILCWQLFCKNMNQRQRRKKLHRINPTIFPLQNSNYSCFLNHSTIIR